MLKIKKIEKEDEQIYIEMSKEFYNSDATLYEVSTENFLNTLKRCLKNDPYLDCYILEIENIKMGYILISKTYSNEVNGMVLLIEEIFIDKKYRNKGYSKKIFKFLKKEYFDYKRFRLEVSPLNSKVISIYEKNGFKNLEYIQMVIDFS